MTRMRPALAEEGRQRTWQEPVMISVLNGREKDEGRDLCN
jgi:hypothetical protein